MCAVDEQAFVRGLDELWRRGIVRAHGPDAYDFSHGRIRDAAYLALSPAQRRHQHLRVAQALERVHAPDVDAASGLLAAQYEAAGAADAAVTWYVRAAAAAQRLHANAGAAQSLERALELNDGLPASAERDVRALAILTALPASLVAVEGYLSDRVVAVHERALGLARMLDVEPEAPLVRSLALASLGRGEFDAARAFGEQLRARGKREADDVLWVESAYVLGVAAYWQGQLHAARTHFEAAVARYRSEHRAAHVLRYGQDPELVCLMRLAHTLWFMGRSDDAARRRDEALALAEDRGHPYSGALVAVFAAIVAPAAPGEPGILMRILLEACAVAGEAQAGLAAADRALEMGAGAQLWEAEVRRLRGEFLDALGAPDAEVEAELVRAVTVAERQFAHALAARARTSLGHLRAERSDQTLAERRLLEDAETDGVRRTEHTS